MKNLKNFEIINQSRHSNQSVCLGEQVFETTTPPLNSILKHHIFRETLRNHFQPTKKIVQKEFRTKSRVFYRFISSVFYTPLCVCIDYSTNNRKDSNTREKKNLSSCRVGVECCFFEFKKFKKFKIFPIEVCSTSHSRC